mmetsp:Transcript_25145/g.75047  ORF Transcript_25145/g.75047 Transcript_25145/m.75047 type:complete len:213 (-) Transcript_25145:253-891(-)
MYVLRGQARQAGQPTPHIGAGGIATLGRVHRVEDKLPVVGPRVASVLPHETVDRHVGVHQRPVEPPQALLPADVEVLNQGLGHDMPQVVWHPADHPQLPHGGINQREARATALPALKLGARARPYLLLVLHADGRLRHGGELPEEPVREVAPDEAPQKRDVRPCLASGRCPLPVPAAVALLLLEEPLVRALAPPACSPVDGPRGELAEADVG